MKNMSAKLTLGPVLFNWTPEKWRDFHFGIADEAPVDSVCLGEVVCSKRAPFFEPVIAEVIERLAAAGKEVVLSTLALIMDAREMDGVRAITESEDLLIEANDMSAVALLDGRPHAVGPYINVYNEGTLAYLKRRGAVRVSLPGELPAKSLAGLANGAEPELEVQVFGRLPLAISARCYHARIHKLQKDGCQYVCGEDDDGLDLDTIDGEPFLAVNGTQTLSYTYCNLIGELAEMQDMGIGRFRISPHDTDMVAVARLFRGVLDGTCDAAGAFDDLADLVDGVPFSNGFYHGTEGVRLTGPLFDPE